MDRVESGCFRRCERSAGKAKPQWAGCGIIAFCLSLGVAGCANPGIPKAPSLRLPATVTDLTGARIGDRVELHWTAPSRTTDKSDLTGPTTVEVCRDPVPTPSSAQPADGVAHPRAIAPPVPCTTVFSTSGHAGASTLSVQLPIEFVRPGVHEVVAYRIRILNSAGRSAAPSAPVLVPCGPAPATVAGFRAEQQKAGVLLEWFRAVGKTSATGNNERVEVLRTLQTPHTSASAQQTGRASKTSKRSVAKNGGAKNAGPSGRTGDQDDADSVRLEADRGAPAGRTDQRIDGMIDESALDQQTYTYTAQRVAMVSGPAVGSGQMAALKILSEPTAPVTITMHDTFPPDPPRGLISVPGRGPIPAGEAGAGGTIDLAWEPNTEADLAGYVVYRTDAGSGTTSEAKPVRLTAAPISGPAYRDTTALAGHRYIYRVTAVDQHGNESVPSAPVEDALDGR